GEAVAVDLEELGGHLDLREILGEGGDVLPMDGAAIAVQQPCPRQHMAAGAERPDIGTLAVDAAQPREEAAVLEEMAIDAAAEDDGAEARGPVDIPTGVQHDAVARGHRLG